MTLSAIIAAVNLIVSVSSHRETVSHNDIKLAIKMDEKALMHMLGEPQQIIKYSDRTQLIYRGKYCVYKDSGCYVILKNSLVQSWSQFKSKYE